MQTQSQAEHRMSRIRTQLLLEHPWFGALALRLNLTEDATLKHIAATNGTDFKFNPTKADELDDSEWLFVWAHEVMHCALLHIWRASGRDHEAWNEACDYAINHALVASNVGRMPKGCLYDPAYADMSAEQIYSARAAQKSQQQQQQQAAQQQPSGAPQQPQQGAGQGSGAQQAQPGTLSQPANPLAGDVLPPAQPQAAQPTQPDTSQPQQAAGDPTAQPQQGTQPAQAGQAGQPMSESDWQTAAEQAAMVARKAGRMSSDADRAMSETRKPKTDVVAELRRFVEQTTPSDYSWLNPNKRYIAQGLYLPGVTKENTPPIIVAIDTSGSVNQDMLNKFGAILTEIMLELRPREIHVIYCDSSVKHTETFTPDDGEVKLTAKGGGGTAFSPVFQHIEEDKDYLYSEVSALVYLTDLLGSDNEQVKRLEPAFPVLWVAPTHCRRPAPFGQLITGDI